MIRRASRRDANEAEIVAALRACGAVVAQLPGDGLPDLLVGFRGCTHLVEVKNPKSTGGAEAGEVRTKGRGRLTKEQVAWFAAWRGSKIHEVVSVDEALAVIGIARPTLSPAVVVAATSGVVTVRASSSYTSKPDGQGLSGEVARVRG